MFITELVDLCLPKDESVDLINVAFDVPGGAFVSPDRVAGIKAFMQLQLRVLLYILLLIY